MSNENRRKEFNYFMLMIDYYGGLPIDDDDQAALAIALLLLDMGFDPHWAEEILKKVPPVMWHIFREWPLTQELEKDV